MILFLIIIMIITIRGMNVQTHTNNRMIRKHNNFGANYGSEGNITEKPNG